MNIYLPSEFIFCLPAEFVKYPEAQIIHGLCIPTPLLDKNAMQLQTKYYPLDYAAEDPLWQKNNRDSHDLFHCLSIWHFILYRSLLQNTSLSHLVIQSFNLII